MGRAVTISRAQEEEAEAEADEEAAGAQLVEDSTMVAGASSKQSNTTLRISMVRALFSLSALLLSRKKCQTLPTDRLVTGCKVCYNQC